jgi:hypothetical protein
MGSGNSVATTTAGEQTRMAEVLRSFDDPVSDGVRSYHVRVVGRYAQDRMWEGWLEFDPLDGKGETLVGPVESRQPEREYLAYWAGGLTPVFVEGALHRAQHPIVVHTRVVEEAASDHPAPRLVVTGPERQVKPEAVLNPFEIGGRNLDILAQELRALNRPRLVNIIAAYDLNPANEDISWMTDAQLVRFIVVAVETQMMRRSG